MNNSDFEATPDAVEYAESDYTDWVNYLPEDTLRELIIKRVLVQNIKYGLEIIHILKPLATPTTMWRRSVLRHAV